MSDVTERSGRCVCGTVRIHTKHAARNIGACHCRTCRRWGGGPLMAVDCGSEVSIEGEQSVSVYDSSPWAERGFCSKCGTHLFYRIKQSQQHMIPVGLFDGDADVVFDHQVFVDEKPHLYAFANETQDMTGAEVFAKFGSSG